MQLQHRFLVLALRAPNTQPPKRTLVLARATLLLNVAVLAHKDGVSDDVKKSLWSETQRALARENDAEAQFSLLAALGTALVNDKTLTPIAVRGGVKEVLARFDSLAYGDKVQNITKEVIEVVADNEV